MEQVNDLRKFFSMPTDTIIASKLGFQLSSWSPTEFEIWLNKAQLHNSGSVFFYEVTYCVILARCHHFYIPVDEYLLNCKIEEAVTNREKSLLEGLLWTFVIVGIPDHPAHFEHSPIVCKHPVLWGCLPQVEAESWLSQIPLQWGYRCVVWIPPIRCTCLWLWLEGEQCEVGGIQNVLFGKGGNISGGLFRSIRARVSGIHSCASRSMSWAPSVQVMVEGLTSDSSCVWAVVAPAGYWTLFLAAQRLSLVTSPLGFCELLTSL